VLTLIRNGGVPVIFVLLFGVLALTGAAYAAARPDERTLRYVKGMCAATVASVFSATCSDLGTTFLTVSGKPGTPTAMLLEGLSESMSPGILGFSLVSLAALFGAIAARRLPTKKD
jgi:hypothetical protein